MEEKLKNASNQAEAKHKKQADDHNKKIKSLQQKVSENLRLSSTAFVTLVFIMDMQISFLWKILSYSETCI